MKYALGLEYDGTHYHGWQRQPELNTVQRLVEQALTKVADHEVEVTCAGRTDTGVHATSQIIHFNSDATRSLRAWIFGCNSNLPKDVSVRWAKEVDESFNARHSATSRRYRYVICNQSIRPGLLRGAVTWHYKPLSCDKMHEAAQHLLGENDFTSFRAINCQSNTPMRNVQSIEVSRKGNLIVIDIIANAFLYHMVRNIVGVLMVIGTGEKDPYWALEVLKAKDRTLGAETAPPHGLYLVDVSYPNEFELPSPPVGPWFLAKE